MFARAFQPGYIGLWQSAMMGAEHLGIQGQRFGLKKGKPDWTMKRKSFYLLTALVALAALYALSLERLSAAGDRPSVADDRPTVAGDRLSPQSSSADSNQTADSSAVEDSAIKSAVKNAVETADSMGTVKKTVKVGDTITTESGLSYVITKAGDGPKSKSGQEISVHFVGRIAESGKEFYNSYKETGPLGFSLGRGAVIKGCDEGITGMAVGEERTLFIPSNLGYGERGHPGAKISPNTDLIFDVTLVSIKKGK